MSVKVIGPSRGVSALVRFADGSYVGESFVRFDGMTWPRADTRAAELNHLLRYGNPSKSDLLMAAEIIGAYEALAAKPSRERAKIVRMLRDAQLILQPVGVYPTEAAADEALRAARERSAAMVHDTGILVRDWGQTFLNQREHDRLRGTKKERNRWKTLVDGSPLADLPMRGVTRADAKAWIRWLGARRIKMASKKHPSHGKRMQRQGMQNALNLVRKAFDEALDDLGLKVNPFAGLKLPKDEGRTHDPWTYLMPDEQTRLLESLWTCPSRWALVAFAMFTGMRQAEVYSLRWADVGSLVITVRYGAQGKATKSGRIRRIPILDKAQEALEIQRGNRKEPKGLVFPNRLGTRRWEGEPSWWKAELDRAGLGAKDAEKRHDGRTIRFHDLRHTCGTSLANGWWGPEWLLQEIQKMLGHAQLATTERYAHVTPEKLLERAKSTKYVPTLLEGKKPKELEP